MEILFVLKIYFKIQTNFQHQTILKLESLKMLTNKIFFDSFPLWQVSSKLVHIPDTSDAVELLILDCSGRKVIFLDHTVDRFEVGTTWFILTRMSQNIRFLLTIFWGAQIIVSMTLCHLHRYVITMLGLHRPCFSCLDWGISGIGSLWLHTVDFS